MHSMLATPVLSLTPDSLASLGDLDGDSLSELWGVFTKCKDSLQNGRRLENLSWRLWFDSGRRDSLSQEQQQFESSRDAPFTAEDGLARAEKEGWSDPEWTEATDSESEGEGLQQQHPLSRAGASRRGSAGVAQQDSLHAPTTPHSSRSGSACGHEPRPLLTREWRSSSTISGGSIQRIITGLSSLPPLAVPIKAHSVIDVAASPLIVSPLPGLTSRHSSAPDELERTPLAAGPPPALHPSPRKATTVDAPTQTTPSTSHRPSPKMSPQLSRAPLSPPTKSASSSAAHPSHAPIQGVSSKSNLARRTSSPRPPPPTPSSFIHDGAHPSNLPPAIRSRSSVHLARLPNEVGPASNASFEGRSFVRGFDTSVFDSRPTQGNIAPPPTPAVALAKLGASPPKRQGSAQKVSPRGHRTTPPTTSHGRVKAKKMFFISSPNSDSDEDGSSSQSRSRSVSLEHHRARRPSSSLAKPPVVAAPVAATAAKSAPPAEEENEWEEEEDDDEDESGSSSGWGSEYSTEDEARASSRTKLVVAATSAPEADRPLFAKRPSQPALTSANSSAGQLKPRPPGLLSQLFHPDLFLDEADRRHSTVDVSRQAHKGKPSLLTTSKSVGVLTEQLRSKSFLKGAPAGTEMESSSEEEEEHSDDSEDDEDSDEYEDEADSPPSAAATALARHQQRIRLEEPIAAPQTPRTTRRAMLATELSESLRRNLLWERQTRNRVMGGPVNRFAQQQAQGVGPAGQPRGPPVQTAPPAVATAGAPNLAPPAATHTSPSFEAQGLRAPHPSPATREHTPNNSAGAAGGTRGEMVRRHTTGTGLYLAAQRDKFPGEHRAERRARQKRGLGSHAHDLHRRAYVREGVDSDSESTSDSSEGSEESEEEEEREREARSAPARRKGGMFSELARVW